MELLLVPVGFLVQALLSCAADTPNSSVCLVVFSLGKRHKTEAYFGAKHVLYDRLTASCSLTH